MADDIELITLDDVKEKTKMLRVLRKDWRIELVKELQKEDPTFTESRVYNILHGIVTHQQHLRLLMKHAIAILKKETKNHKKVTNMMDAETIVIVSEEAKPEEPIVVSDTEEQCEPAIVEEPMVRSSRFDDMLKKITR